MSWENRGNNSYYYKKRRINDSVISEYIGKGELACLVARFDTIERSKSDSKKERIKTQRKDLEKFDYLINEISETNNLLVKALFLINGYHTHKYEWRKKRKKKVLQTSPSE